MNKQWIITGANGYLGGNLCKGLRLHGYPVHGFARGERAKDTLVSSGIPCHAYEALAEVLIEDDIVVHCAGKADNTGRWKDYLQTNVEWSLSLFDQAEAKGAGCFIYVSSVAALGYQNRTGENTLDESSEPRLLDGELYGWSKYTAEEALHRRAKQAQMRLIILRPGLIYGHRPFGPSNAKKRGIIIDSRQRLPLVHMDSFLDAVLKVASHVETQGIFFVVDEEQPTIHELNLIKMKLGIIQHSPRVIGSLGFKLLTGWRHLKRFIHPSSPPPPRGFAHAQYAFATRRLTYSTEKLRQATGWRPARTLADGLKECIESTLRADMTI